jgi:DHA1 family inner membrane transport protein
LSGPPGLRRVTAQVTFQRQTGAAIAALAAASAVVVTTEFIVVGLLPGLARDLGVSLDRAGWLVSWFALSSAVLGPIVTVVASQVHPRRVLALLLCPFAIGNLILACAPSYPIAALVRVMQGAALPAFVSIASATVAHLAGAVREGRALARINLGAIVAVVLLVPAGVAIADRTGWRPVFLALASLAGIAAVITCVAVPHVEPAPRASVRAQAAILRDPVFHAHLLLSAILFAAMFTPYTYLVSLLESAAGLDGQGIALALAAFGIAGLAGNWLAGRVADREPTLSTAAASLALALATAAAPPSAANPALLAPILATWGAAHAAAFLLCQVRVMRAGPRAPAFALSLNISACNMGIAAGAAAGGAATARFGIESIGGAGAALAALALFLALILARGSTTTR